MQFERTTPEQGNGIHEFITVIEEFQHFYTKETMRVIRIEFVGSIFGAAYAKTEIVNEKEFERLLASKIA